MKILFLLISTVLCLQANQAEAARVRIKVIHRSADSWQVTYQFDQPTKKAIFSRQRNQFRHLKWKVMSKKVSLKVSDKFEALVTTDGKPFKEVVITHDSFFDHLPKDYYHFYKFSDGMLLSTGHYNIASTDRSKFAVKNHFVFQPLESEKVMVGDHFSKKSAEWTDELGGGSYVYFGNITPTRSKYMLSLVDPKTPKWVKQTTEPFLAKLYKFYTKKLGRRLDEMPTIFISHMDRDKDYMANKGGTLEGQIQLEIRGKRLETETAESRLWLLKFLAHEAAHMWNSQMYLQDGNNPWLHEGGADAFAYRALFALGVIDKSQYSAKLEEAATRCAWSLHYIGPLRDAAGDGRFNDYYYCGSTIALATEQAIGSKDLFVFWCKLFNVADKTQKSYTAKQYLALLADTGSRGKNLAKKIDSFIDSKHTDGFDAVRSLFDDKNVTLSVSNTYPKYYQKLVRKLLAQSVADHDCGRSSNIKPAGRYYRLKKGKSCKKLSANDEIQAVNDIDTFLEPIKAYDSYFSGCRNGRVFVVKTHRNKVKIQCDTSLAKRRRAQFKFGKLMFLDKALNVGE